MYSSVFIQNITAQLLGEIARSLPERVKAQCYHVTCSQASFQAIDSIHFVAVREFLLAI